MNIIKLLRIGPRYAPTTSVKLRIVYECVDLYIKFFINQLQDDFFAVIFHVNLLKCEVDFEMISSRGFFG